MRSSWRLVPALFLALGAAMYVTPEMAQAQPDRKDGTKFRGKIVRVAPNGNSYVVRVDGGKELTFYAGDRTTYRYRDRAGRFDDYRVGMTISGAYTTRDDRYWLSSVALEEDAASPEDRREPGEGGTVRGKIQKADPLVITTADGKEIVLHLENRMEASFTFVVRDGKRYLTGMTTAAVREVPGGRSDSGPVRGEIVRIEGEDRFIIRTDEGKEITFYADPKSTYEHEGRAIKFGDLSRGWYVDVDFDQRDRKNYTRKVISRPRRGR